MEKIAKYAQTVRNNWKKSVVGAVAFYFAIDKLKEKYEYVLLKLSINFISLTYFKVYINKRSFYHVYYDIVTYKRSNWSLLRNR